MAMAAEDVTAAVAEVVAALAVRLARRMSPQQVGEFLIEVVYEMFVGEVRARELEREELGLLAELTRADWRRVSPGILGTLLERALAPGERKQLGAFYTADRQIRLVVEKTVIEPLRAEWSKLEGRAAQIEFLRRLRRVRVLDPACGTGNFLVVVFTLLREFEMEVVSSLGVVAEARAVQLLGIEVDPWTARVAELVLRIAYLQAGAAWRHSIELGDALIIWEERRTRVDAQGQAVMRAGGVTERRAARAMVAVEEFVGVARRAWPAADFIVGNPPFLGNKRMSDVLGAGYVAAIKAVYPEVHGSADLVMWWWWRSAELVARGEVTRFGLVTTNSITQAFNRGVVAEALTRIRLVHAIADLPWYDAGAAVRIAVTVGARDGDATIGVEGRPVATIHADLTAGADVAAARPLAANKGLCFQGMNLVGEGFRLTAEEVRGLGYSTERLPAVVRPYVIGRDLMRRSVERYVIDFNNWDPAEARAEFPGLWARLEQRVRPARERNNRASRRRNWWLFGEPVGKLRSALVGLRRYIATPETAKHRIFQFVDASKLPDHTIYAVASEDPFVLGVLSSRVHLVWARCAGGTLEDRPRWNNTLCFLKFPFPERSDAVAELGEALDGLRKRRQSAEPGLAWTDVYNRLGEHPELLELHARLDRAVFAAYGWSYEIGDDELLARLVVVNAARG